MATKSTKSVSSLNKTLKKTIDKAKGLGIDTSKAESVSKQTDRQGGTSYKGSTEEKQYNNTITSASLKQNKPYVPPEKPQVTDPGNLALAGNAGIASILEPLGFTQNDNGQIGMGDILKFQQDNQPDLPNLENQYYGSREYKDVKKAQREVTDYTSQLNSITANSQAQQLSLEGQGRGQTSSFVGGEQARINREAAIAALPIQAQLSASQGNLEFAQKQLDTVFTLRSQDAQNKYKFETDKLNSIVSFLNQAETRQYNARLQGEERTYNQTQNNLNYLRQLSAQAREYGNTGVIGQLGAIDPASETFEQDVSRLAQKIQKPVATGGGTSNQMSDNERALMTQFRGEQIVKDYNEILGQKGTIDAYIQNGVGGPADLALVFSFMKGLDPSSVVRESEYETAAKSGNIFQGAFAKYNGYFKEKGGFLPENVRQEFQNLVNQKLAVKESQYQNLTQQYTGIAQRQGLNPQNVVIDYAQGGYKPQPTPVTSPTTIETPITRGFWGTIGNFLWGND